MTKHNIQISVAQQAAPEPKGLTPEETEAYNSMVSEHSASKPNPEQAMYDDLVKTYESQTNPKPEKTEDSPNENLIMGKFKSQEDLEKAYIELQRKLSSGEKAEEDSEETPETSETPSWLNAEYEEGSAGAAIQQANKDVMSGGEITEETYAALEQAGIPRDVAEAYANQAVQAQAEQSASIDTGETEALEGIVESLGGNETFKAVQEWAGKNLTKEEVEYVDNIAENGTLEDLQFVYSQLNQRYQLSVQQVPSKESRLVKGENVVTTATDVYRSRAEEMRDMKDPRYENDPAYRSRVYEKMSRSCY